jgi:hypothetical protein
MGPNIMPSNAAILALVRANNQTRLLQLVDDTGRLQRDYRGTPAELGPIAGYGGGFTGRR